MDQCERRNSCNTDRVMEETRGATSSTTVGPATASCSSRSAATAGAVDADSDHHHQIQPSPDHGSWLCCVPCYWLRRNNSLHKASLTVATLVVMSLLVASPVIFLISGVPAREGDRTRECVHQVGAFDCWIFLMLFIPFLASMISHLYQPTHLKEIGSHI
jgi:hypothetical protein